MTVAYMQARAGNYASGRSVAKPTVIVIHTVEADQRDGVAVAVGHWWQTTLTQTSAHVIVDALATVRSVLDKDTAYQCGTHGNRIGLGIEHAGYARMTAAQWASPYSVSMLRRSAVQAASWCVTYGIPVRKLSATDLIAGRSGLAGHVDIHNAWPADTSHTDPGANFPWSTYLSMINELLHPAPVPLPTPKNGYNMAVMYVRATGTYAGNPVLVEGGKQVALGMTGSHANAYSSDGVPYATTKDAALDAAYDKAYGPVVGP